MRSWFKILSLLALLTLGSTAARAQFSCTYLGPYPWQPGGCLTAGDLNAAIAAALAPPSSLQTGVAAANLGSASGDVTGPWNLLKVIGLQGFGVSTTAPANGQLLQWNSSSARWEPSSRIFSASDLSNGTVGTGAIVLQNSPPLITPNLGAAIGTSINLATNPSILVGPTGNGASTLSTFNVQGTATVTTQREFLVTLGLTSSQAFATNAGTNNDKAVLYTGMVCNHSLGTSDADCWSINPLTTLGASYNGIGQVAQLDLNNNAQDRLLPTTNPTGFGGAVPNWSGGIEVSGSAAFRNTVAFAIGGAKWQFGYMALSDISQAAYYENVNSVLGLDLEGTHTAALAIGLGGLAPQGSAVDIRQGLNNRLLIRGHQNLASGSTITSGNDAGSGFSPLEIQASQLLLDSFSSALGINLAGNAPLAGVVDVRQGVDRRFLISGPQTLTTGMALTSYNDAGNAFVPLEIRGSVILHSGGPIALLSMTAPTAPPTGQFYLYVDTATGDLVAKGPSGTATVVALP